MADEVRSDVETGDRGHACTSASGPAPQASTEQQARREARRRILAGGLAGAPFVVTLTSRPAFATYCSPSATTSGNPSRAALAICSGLTPEWWFSHPDDVANCGIIVGPCNPLYYDGATCSDYSVPTTTEIQQYLSSNASTLSPDEKRALNAYKDLINNEYPNSPPFGTPFSDIFGTGLLNDEFTTIMQSLGAGNGLDMAAQCSAAYLNAVKFGKEEYGMTPSEVVAFVQAGWPTYDMQDMLTTMNGRS
ncbi:hypothetical protein [Pelagibius marinus]|uniref:hypothetical protein n=1 Tax=Pelagibius marinus TaxID=2762760 RepID=UPI0018722D40|nr:hypothetical protein [Pelagibius marinus]